MNLRLKERYNKGLQYLITFIALVFIIPCVYLDPLFCVLSKISLLLIDKVEEILAKVYEFLKIK